MKKLLSTGRAVWFERLLVAAPWFFLLALFHFHFQSFLPGQRLFRGLEFFDFMTVLDVYVGVLVLVFAWGFVRGRVKFVRRKLPLELSLCTLFLMVAGVAQFLFQRQLEPVLSTPTEYFRSLFVFPLLYALLLFRTAEASEGHTLACGSRHTPLCFVHRVVRQYFLMVSVFCVLALVQHFGGFFPGEPKDFMGRLVWPFIDFVTLKSSSANWVAFFVTPAVVLSFIQIFPRLQQKGVKWMAQIFVSPSRDGGWDAVGVLTFILAGVTLYLTQSYGGYIAVFGAVLVYLFRALPFKRFAVAMLVMALLGSGVYIAQKNTWKYQVLTGEAEYRFETSATSRADIYRMNLAMITERPVLGVGLNQYQSWFAAEQTRVLGGEINESHVPPHAHNFFMSFWMNLGVLGFLAMLILVVGIVWRTRLSADYPAVFVLLAIMAHGLIDSYYWKQEIAYTFWLVIVLCYVWREK